MKKFFVLLSALLVISAVISGCVSGKPDYPALCNVMWIPESGPSGAALQLNPYGRAAGFTGNNRFFAPAEFDAAGNLRFGAIAITCFISIAVLFMALYAEDRFSKVEREVQLLRERSVRLQEQLFSRTTHAAIAREVEERGLGLQEPRQSREVVED